MEWSRYVILAYVAMLFSMSCSSPTGMNGSMRENPPSESDAQFICDVLTECFALELGNRCALDIEETTLAADITRCADCYETATCDDIGEPGVAGVCDVACHAALFGYDD